VNYHQSPGYLSFQIFPDVHQMPNMPIHPLNCGLAVVRGCKGCRSDFRGLWGRDGAVDAKTQGEGKAHSHCSGLLDVMGVKGNYSERIEQFSCFNGLHDVFDPKPKRYKMLQDVTCVPESPQVMSKILMPSTEKQLKFGSAYVSEALGLGCLGCLGWLGFPKNLLVVSDSMVISATRCRRSCI
jgi:hypothetical protein